MSTLSQKSLLALALASIVLTAQASSHREAPFITEHPKVDGTDFYMFRSYEHGRDGYITLIANYRASLKIANYVRIQSIINCNGIP